MPVAVRGYDRGAALQISGQIEALVCSDICVPLAGALRLDLADGPAEPSSMAMAIAQFAAKVPRIDAPSPIKIATAWQSGSQLKIGFAATSQPITEIFVEGPADIAFKQPVFASNIAVIDLASELRTPLAGQTVDLTVIAGDDFTTQSIMVEKDAPLARSFAAGKPEPIGASATVHFWTVIGLSLIHISEPTRPY